MTPDELREKLRYATQIDKVGEVKPERSENPVTLANWVTLSGYAAGLYWVSGGPAWAALYSILADEADGIVARSRGESTEFGSNFDWGADIILAALTLLKLRAPLWTVPTATVIQVWLREQGKAPPVGSLRAALMLYGVIAEANRG